CLLIIGRFFVWIKSPLFEPRPQSGPSAKETLMKPLLRPNESVRDRRNQNQSQPFGRPQQRIAPIMHRYGGIHLRRDKRYLFSQRGNIDAIQPPSLKRVEPAEPDTLKAWKEAVMLWL